MRKKTREILFSSIILGSCVTLLLLTPLQIGKRLIGKRTIPFPPSAMPTIALSLMALFCMVWLITLFQNKGEYDEPIKSSDAPSLVRVGVTFSIMCLGAFAINRIGFISMSFLITVLLLIYFGVRNWITIIAISVAIPSFIYFFFERFMKIPLPEGILF